MSQPDTRPIPSGRYAAPNPAPNTPTECPRCGAPAISTRGVALHDLDHRQRDLDARRQKTLLDRLETLLDSIEWNVDEDTGERLTLAAWIHQTDGVLDDIESALGETGWIRQALDTLKRQPVETTLEAPAFEVLPWPGDPGTPDEDETVEDDDRDADEIIPSSATHSFPGDEQASAAARERDAREIAADLLSDEPEPDEDLLAARDDDDFSSDAWGVRR